LKVIRFWILEFLEGFFNNASSDIFHSLAHISGKDDRILVKIFVIDVRLDKEVSIKV